MNFYIIDDVQETKRLQAQSNLDTNTAYRREWCEAWAVNRKNGAYERCPLCGRPVSMLKWEPPRKMRLVGTKYPDRLSEWLMEPLVLSERFIEAYQRAKLSGISTFSEIEVVRKKATAPPAPRYYLAEVDYSQSVCIDLHRTILYGEKNDWSCAVCNPFGSTCSHITHLALNTAKWDGTDLFRVYAVGTVCSQRFYDFVNDFQFTNFNLVPISEYTF